MITSLTILVAMTWKWTGLAIPYLGNMGPYIGLALLLPVLFLFQNRWKLDRQIGELSYPIYVVHWMMMGVSYHFLGNIVVVQPSLFPLLLRRCQLLRQCY